MTTQNECSQGKSNQAGYLPYLPIAGTVAQQASFIIPTNTLCTTIAFLFRQSDRHRSHTYLSVHQCLWPALEYWVFD